MANKYYIVTFDDAEDKTPTEVYIIDMKRKRILLYQMYQDCMDRTKQLQRMYETDMKKGGFDRRIGCDLIDLMNNRPERVHWAETLLATDDAREVTRRVAAIRSRWFAIHSDVLKRTSESELAGWSRHNDPDEDDAWVANHFTDL